MDDPTQTARITALWMIHGNSLAMLLRRHGRAIHADNLDAALGEVAEIMSGEIGREPLTQAMNWASDQIWTDGDSLTAATLRN